MTVWVGWYTVWSSPLIGPPSRHQSCACTLKPNVVLPTGGSMRPPPVNFSPAGQVPDPPAENDGLGLAGVAGRSQPHASSVAATRPGPNRSEEHTSELQSQSNLVCRL